ncbi:MAG TPA: glycosyl hydrolase family 18 protein [bacterium]|jgi:spore germination protein YaaH
MACILAVGAPAVSSNAASLLSGAGYWVDYDPNSLVTVSAQGSRLNWVIATQFALAGTAGGITGTHNAQLMKAAQDQGAAVHFNVANYLSGGWSRPVVHSVLTSSQARDRTIRDILGLLDKYGYDGVSLDFENVSPNDRHALTAFVIRLAAAVHGRGKDISIAVPAKIRDDLTNDWNGAFDYAALASAVEAIIVMAYDEHWDTSEPGPIASEPWVDAVAQFAASETDPAKVLLGVAFYGYAWPTKGAAEGISMREAVDRAKRAGVTIQWDSTAKVPFYKLPGFTVYFEDARSVSRKMGIAKARALGGVAFWRLGQENPGVWSVLAPYLQVNSTISVP